MIKRLDDGIKCPCANDVVRLGTQAGREVLSKPGGIIDPASDDHWRAGRRGPRVHDIWFWLKFS